MHRDLRCCFFHTPWQLLWWRLGWKDCCCRWLWRVLLAILRMPAPSGVMLTTVPDLRRKSQAWKEVACTQRLSPGRLARREEHLLLPSGDTEGPPSWLRPASSRAQQVPRGQSTCLPGLRLSQGLMAHQTPISGLVCSTAFTPSIFHSQASRRDNCNFLSLPFSDVHTFLSTPSSLIPNP